MGHITFMTEEKTMLIETDEKLVATILAESEKPSVVMTKEDFFSWLDTQA